MAVEYNQYLGCFDGVKLVGGEFELGLGLEAGQGKAVKAGLLVAFFCRLLFGTWAGDDDGGLHLFMS